MATELPYDDGNGWGKGARSVAAKLKVSKATMKHGGRKAEQIFWAEGKFSGHMLEIRNQVLSEVPELSKIIENGGLLAHQANRYLDAETVRRIWKAIELGTENLEDFDRFSDRGARWLRVTDKLCLDLISMLEAQNSNVLDYEVMTHGNT